MVEKISHFDLGCKNNCRFIGPDGIRPCGAVQPGVQCSNVRIELRKEFQSWPVTTENYGKDVVISMDKKKIAILANGTVVLNP
jgi:hypothetical protein